MLADRAEAGEKLAERLRAPGLVDPLVLALPRGGVPVARPVSRRLGCPLDVLVCRKVGAPGNPEYGVGAVVEDGTVVLDESRVRGAGFPPTALQAAIAREERAARELAHRYRGGRPLPRMPGRTVVVVDDGIATGVTVRAAVKAVRLRAARAVVVAAGVAPPETVVELEREADRVVLLEQPPRFFAVGEFYRRFEPVTDEEVAALLAPD